MKTIRSVALFSFLACGAVWAQRVEIGVMGGYPHLSGTPLGSVNVDTPLADDTKLKGQYSYGVALTWNTRGYYGSEIGYFQSRATFRTNVSTTTDSGSTVTTLEKDRVMIQRLAYNFLIYFMPAGERWRPFVTGGIQVYKYGAPRIAAYPGGGSRDYGANYGGGVKLKLFSHALARWDVRDYIGGSPYKILAGHPGGRIHQIEATLGLAITF